MIYGYARVSTGGQTIDLQQDALVRAGCDRVFTDVASGAKAHRPELGHMLDLLRGGDTVVVWKLGRLGRSMQNLVDNQLGNRVGVVFQCFRANQAIRQVGSHNCPDRIHHHARGQRGQARHRVRLEIRCLHALA
ncbi:recombinase family protein [Bifidobacterium moukalabense]|uniref:recombinase family protein n=1 Tax=Bifidobacterium moukalabense TaxID=1333651 RepID=UPI0010F70A01|nr:recombinase family protein [Bifidobacterium moukalabense]